MSSLYQLEMDAVEDLKERLADSDGCDQDDIAEIVNEVTESRIPVYTSDILKLAADNFRFVTTIPDI